MNLATTPTGLTPGSFERHLQRHPEDRIYRPLLEGIFAAWNRPTCSAASCVPASSSTRSSAAFCARSNGQLQLVSEDADLNR